MSEKIEKFGKDAHGQQCSEGFYAVHPDGHVVLLPPSSQLKPGFRYATESEVASGKPDAPAAAPASEPAALPASE